MIHRLCRYAFRRSLRSTLWSNEPNFELIIQSSTGRSSPIHKSKTLLPSYYIHAAPSNTLYRVLFQHKMYTYYASKIQAHHSKFAFIWKIYGCWSRQYSIQETLALSIDNWLDWVSWIYCRAHSLTYDLLFDLSLYCRAHSNFLAKFQDLIDQE